MRTSDSLADAHHVVANERRGRADDVRGRAVVLIEDHPRGTREGGLEGLKGARRTCVRMHTCVHVRMHACASACMRVCMYVRLHVCAYVCMHACMLEGARRTLEAIDCLIIVTDHGD